MIDALLPRLRWARDRWRLRAWHPAQDGPAVVIVLFHGLFASSAEVRSGLCDPQQGITVRFFREFVESLLESGVSIWDLEAAFREPSSGLGAVITFDDGYANNQYALDVLQEFRIPATFFISTNHVVEQKAFWWDALYRGAARQGQSEGWLRRRRQALKQLRAQEVEARLIAWLGAGALTPVSECDRPFTAAELTSFARSPYVALGNHTSDHGILVNYDEAGMRRQIEDAQLFLADVAQGTPRSIAYPNGTYDARVVATARSLGLQFGVTVESGLNQVARAERMTLRRLTVWGVPSAARQGRAIGRLARRSS